MNNLASVSRVLAVLSLGATLLEVLAYKFVFKRDYGWRSALATLAVIVGRSFTRLIPIAITLPGATWLYEHRIFNASEHGVASWVALFFGIEFLYYWYHRLGHRVRWFWLSHAVHHSTNEINLVAAGRLAWTSQITGAYAIFSPLALLGFTPETILAGYALNLSYQFWIHADWAPKLGFLEGIFNTPSAHRVHHAANLDYLDANYGGVLMLFDRLFGTYIPERDDLPCRYGLVHPLTTNNPLKIVFHQFGPFFRDVMSARSPREVWGYIISPPGWRPDGNSETTEDMRRKAAGEKPAEAAPAPVYEAALP
ncbi:Sterol desaturase [Cystobacter fuscus DSM 2262]|uniref:Sterol desaturase n=1 Tax=Cystobacter fuscus (strain ATCC 25194 / DSM 2262 / NBRC 100088 / M29) TaxID=1242864 RepID=S9P8C2_CYSF2|nr:sterol desaturase family protein [Cystobacter fuscus]EPX60670.1 Sterol desaturase [Cystobacter fuscus DSM 2262]